MERFKLSRAQQALLREQVIDAERPGPVLGDFRTLLDFLTEQGGVKAKGKYNLLPIESLGELNRRLSRPLVLELKRPQLRSHPYLQGLHLLLRATGLGRVEGTGTRARLVLDPALRAQWDRLNPTEQYFNLLEAWLRVGRPEMVGEASRSWGTLLTDCLQTFAHLPARGNDFDLERPQYIYLLGIGRDLYQLALLDLFGLMDVKRPSQPVQPWRPASVGHLPFGDAVLTLLAEHFYNPGTLLALQRDENQRADFGAWQPLFQPYFPEWRENLRIAAPEPRTGVFLFRVALGKARRLIAIPADAPLDDLVSWVLRSVKFSSDHLYEFIYRDQRGRQVRVHHPYTGEEPSTDQVHVGELPLEPGQSMTLVYDFGDNWQFNLTLERVEPPGKKMKAPRIVESHGAAPEQYPSWEE